MTSKFIVFGLILVTLGITIGIASLGQWNNASAADIFRWGTPGPGNNGNANPGTGNGYGNGNGQGNLNPQQAYSPLSDAEKEALNQAINEEYGALNLYNSVISKFGNVAPFSQIVKAEQQHINALTRQAGKYGVTLPENSGSTTSATFSTLQEACQAGIAAEKADALLYDKLMKVTDHSDINRVYSNLQSASLYKHLPAFETCQ